MLSYFSRSPTSSSPEYKKGRYQVLEVDNEDNSLEDQAVKDTFQDALPRISADTLQRNEVSQKGDGSS